MVLIKYSLLLEWRWAHPTDSGDTVQARSLSSSEIEKLRQQLKDCRSDLSSKEQHVNHYAFEAQTNQVRPMPMQTPLQAQVRSLDMINHALRAMYGQDFC